MTVGVDNLFPCRSATKAPLHPPGELRHVFLRNVKEKRLFVCGVKEECIFVLGVKEELLFVIRIE